jgi:DNA polymerase-3 subunit delta
MAKAIHAIDYLADTAKHAPRPVCAVFGEETFLRRQVVARLRKAVAGDRDGEFSVAVFEGPNATLADVLDELSTMALFGGGKRLVVVEAADPFVTRYRAELENYVAKPKSSGLLVLEVKSWPSNTRLAKAVAAGGLAVDCASPKSAQLFKWVRLWAAEAHNVQLAPSAAELLVEMVGSELGLLDQEIARLALTVQPGEKLTAPMVQKAAGSWRSKTTWEMLDAALVGNAREAMLQLDRLFLSGEHPVAILGQISATLRRLAAATRTMLLAEAAGRRTTLRAALQGAGIKPFVLSKAEGQLRHLGRHRGGRLYRWLLQADLDLKGASSIDPHLVLQRLILRLAAPQEIRS